MPGLSELSFDEIDQLEKSTAAPSLTDMSDEELDRLALRDRAMTALANMRTLERFKEEGTDTPGASLKDLGKSLKRRDAGLSSSMDSYEPDKPYNLEERKQEVRLAIHNEELAKSGKPPATELPPDLQEVGPGEALTDRVLETENLPIVGGFVQGYSVGRVALAARRIEKAQKRGDQGDVEDLNTVVSFLEDQAQKMRPTTFAGGAVEMGGKSLSFAADLLVGGEVVKVASKGGVKLARRAGRKKLSSILTKTFLDEAATVTGKALQSIPKGMAEAINPTMWHRSYSAAWNFHMPDVHLSPDEENQLKLEISGEGSGWAKSLMLGTASTMMETITERGGDWMGPAAKKFTKFEALRRTALVSEVTKRGLFESPVKAARFLRRFGIHGLSEIPEEDLNSMASQAIAYAGNKVGFLTDDEAAKFSQPFLNLKQRAQLMASVGAQHAVTTAAAFGLSKSKKNVAAETVEDGLADAEFDVNGETLTPRQFVAQKPAEALEMASKASLSRKDMKDGVGAYAFSQKDRARFAGGLRVAIVEDRPDLLEGTKEPEPTEKLPEKPEMSKKVDVRTPNQKTIDNFVSSKNSEDASVRSYWIKAELVSVEELERFVDIDRSKAAGEGGAAQDRYDTLQKSVENDGINDIAILTYSATQRKAYLSEGNHRLAVAKKLGIKAIPVRVIRFEDSRGTMNMSASRRPLQASVPGVEPDKFGYTPGDMRPSQIGIPVVSPDDGKLPEKPEGVPFAPLPESTEETKPQSETEDETGLPPVVLGATEAKPGATKPEAIPPSPIKPQKLSDKVSSDSGYSYHATNEERLQDIAKSGQLDTHSPSEFTDQDVWPDGSSEPRSYFSDTASTVWSFAPEDGTPVVIRTKNGSLGRESTGDRYSTEPIPVGDLEYLGVDDQWHPVSGLAVPSSTPPAEEPPKKPAIPPSEPVEREPGSTSIKNAVVDEEREKRGLRPAMEPAAKSFGAFWDAAMQKTQEERDAIVADLSENPRAIGPVEDAVLLHKQITLQNEYDNTLDEIAKAESDGNNDKAIELTRQEVQLSGELLQLYDTNKAVGTETGRGLAARKMLAKEDFTLAKMLYQKRKAKGELTEADQESVRKAHQEIAALEKRVQELEQQQRQAAVADAIDEKIEQFAKKPKKQTKRAAEARKRLKKSWAEFERDFGNKLFSTPLDPALVKALAKIARDYIVLGATTVADFTANIKDKIGEKRAAQLGDAIQASWNEAVEQSKPSAPASATTAATISNYADQLFRFFMSQGVNTRESAIDAVHAEMVKVFPDFTRDDTMDAMSGYGEFRPLSKDEMDIQRRQWKGEMQQLAKLRDMRAGKAPRATGQERQTPSDEGRRLTAQVNEMKKKGGFDTADPGKKLRSALEARKKRLTNRIADRREEIRTGVKNVPKKSAPPTDAEVERLEAELKEVNKEYKEVFGTPRTTDDQRRAVMKAVKRRQIAEYDRRIAEGDFSKKPKRRKTPYDKELDKLQFKLETTKKKYLEALQADIRANMTTGQKVFDAARETNNLARTVITSGEISAVLRQGGIALASHPTLIKNIKTSFTSFGSKRASARTVRNLEHRKMFPLAKRSGVEITSHDGPLSTQEEVYRGRWAEKVPILAGSERSYVDFLNVLRMDLFESLINSLSVRGVVSETDAKFIANYVNVVTGRGGKGVLKRAAMGTADLFFSPMWVLSRFQYLLGQPLRYKAIEGGVSREARLLIAKEYARAALGATVVLGSLATALWAAYGPPGDDKEWNIELNLVSSDFGKVRVGNVRRDFLSGLSQATVFMSRMLSRRTKTLYRPSVDGEPAKPSEIKPLTGPLLGFTDRDLAKVSWDFFRSKLAPVPSKTWDILTGKDFNRKPINAGNLYQIPRDLMTPLAHRDVYDAMKAEGATRTVIDATLVFLGIGLQAFAHESSFARRVDRFEEKLRATSGEEKKAVRDEFLEKLAVNVSAPAPSGWTTEKELRDSIPERVNLARQSVEELKRRGISLKDASAYIGEKYSTKSVIKARVARLKAAYEGKAETYDEKAIQSLLIARRRRDAYNFSDRDATRSKRNLQDIGITTVNQAERAFTDYLRDRHRDPMSDANFVRLGRLRRRWK